MSDSEAEGFMLGHRYPSPADVADAVGNREVLDLGCGKGIDVGEHYSPKKYIGIDCSRALIEIARRDNPGFEFVVSEIPFFLSCLDSKSVEVSIMVAVLEHLPSLEDAKKIVKQARRVSRELIIGWHTPPKYRKTEIIKVKAELSEPIYQNRYEIGSFGDAQVRPVTGGELWFMRD